MLVNYLPNNSKSPTHYKKGRGELPIWAREQRNNKKQQNNKR